MDLTQLQRCLYYRNEEKSIRRGWTTEEIEDYSLKQSSFQTTGYRTDV